MIPMGVIVFFHFHGFLLKCIAKFRLTGFGMDSEKKNWPGYPKGVVFFAVPSLVLGLAVLS
jgi:hypothetical protein